MPLRSAICYLLSTLLRALSIVGCRRFAPYLSDSESLPPWSRERASRRACVVCVSMLWHYRTDVRDLGDLLADRDPDQEISRLSLCERDRGTEPPLLSIYLSCSHIFRSEWRVGVLAW